MDVALSSHRVTIAFRSPRRSSGRSFRCSVSPNRGSHCSRRQADGEGVGLSVVRPRVRSRSQHLRAPTRRSALAGQTRGTPGFCTSVPLFGHHVPPPHLHRAPAGCCPTQGPTHAPSGPGATGHRPGCGGRARIAAGAPPRHAGQRRHAAAPDPRCSDRSVSAAARGWRGRMGVATRSALRHDPRRFGTQPSAGPAAGPPSGQCGRVATPPSGRRGGRPRSGRRLRRRHPPGCSAGAAGL